MKPLMFLGMRYCRVCYVALLACGTAPLCVKCKDRQTKREQRPLTMLEATKVNPP